MIHTSKFKFSFRGQLKCNVEVSRAHQTRRSRRNSHPISAEVTLARLQSKIKITLFLFANNLRFMVMLVDKVIVINGKIHKNKRKRFYSSNNLNKEGLIQLLTKTNLSKLLNLYWQNSRWKLNHKSKNIQTDTSCTKLIVELYYILIIFNKT